MILTVIVLIGQNDDEVKAKWARLARLGVALRRSQAGAMAKRAIDPASFADEVLIVKEKFPISDFSEVRNRALDRARGEWVLFVDSDEEVTAELRDEILYRFRIKSGMTGYKLRRRDRFLEKWLKHGETASVGLLRLAKKNAGKWTRPVHEVWQVNGRIGELKNPLFHYSHDTVEEMVEKIDGYSGMEAEYRSSVIPCSTRNLYRFQLIAGMTLFPTAKFIQNYILRLGFLDGVAGFIHAGMMSFHSFLVRAKMLSRMDAN